MEKNLQRKNFGQILHNFGVEVLQGTRDNIAEHEANACFIERENNIAIAAVAMRDAGLKDETIISMLQKHWDLRQSETGTYIEWAHSCIPEKTQACQI